MSAVNKFATEEEYNAHTKSTDNSEVSLVGSEIIHSDSIRYDGVNVENLSGVPAIGDCLYLDSNNQRHFFYGDTVNNELLENDGYTPVGVVAVKYGNNKVLLVHKTENETGERFCSACIQKLSNFKIDGTSNNIQVRWYNSSGTKTIIADTFTESCSSLQDFVTKFDAFLRENQVSAYNWHCELLSIQGVDTACVVIDKYTYYQQYQSIIESGASAAMINWDFVDEDSSVATDIKRVNGGVGYRPVFNKERTIEYFSTSNSTDSLSDSITNGSGILNQTDFHGNNYPTIKSYYNDDYEAYIDSVMMLTKPILKCNQVLLQDGETLCNKMKSVTYPNLSGTDTYLFSACKWATDLTTGGLEWRMPDVNEAFDIFSKINLDGSDAMNVGLYNMSGKRLIFKSGSSTYSRWVVTKRSRNSAWLLSSGGYFIYSYMYNRYRVVAVSLLNLTEEE